MIIRDNFCYFSMKAYVVVPHLNRLAETVETVQMKVTTYVIMVYPHSETLIYNEHN